MGYEATSQPPIPERCSILLYRCENQKLYTDFGLGIRVYWCLTQSRGVFSTDVS